MPLREQGNDGTDLRSELDRNVFGFINTSYSYCFRECKDIQIDVKCDHYRAAQNNRVRRQVKDGGVYVMEAELPVVK